MGDAGYYNTIVKNSCGGVASGIARVVVRDPLLELPEIAVSPSAIVIGEIPVGYDKTVTQTDLISNTGIAPLQITGLAISGSSNITAVNPPALPLVLAPGAKQSLSFKATAPNIGVIGATLTITSNDPSGALTLPLGALGVLRYNHNTIQAFDTVLINNVAEKCFTLENTSLVDIVIDQITVSGTDAALFQLTNVTTPLAIPSKGSVQVCVRYSPTARGNNSAQISFTSSTGGNSTASLSGVGKEPVSVEEGILAGLSVSPNPTTEAVEITLPKELTGATITVADVAGNTIATVGTVTNELSMRWDGKTTSGAPAASGTYNVIVRTSTVVYSLPLVIVR